MIIYQRKMPRGRRKNQYQASQISSETKKYIQQQIGSISNHQLKQLSGTLDTQFKRSLLKNKGIRTLVIQLIKIDMIQQFSCSYFGNRKQHNYLVNIISIIGALSCLRLIKVVSNVSILKRFYQTLLIQNQITDTAKDTLLQLFRCSSRFPIEEKMRIIIKKQERVQLIEQLQELLTKAYRQDKIQKRILQGADKVKERSKSDKKSNTQPGNSLFQSRNQQQSLEIIQSYYQPLPQLDREESLNIYQKQEIFGEQKLQMKLYQDIILSEQEEVSFMEYLDQQINSEQINLFY